MIEKMNKVVSRWEDLEISGSHSGASTDVADSID